MVVSLNSRNILKMSKVFIIAEAGVNHNGSLKLAKKMIDKAKEACADAIKFQTFKAESLVSKNSPKAAYQLKNTDKSESHFEMIKRLELNRDSHIELIEYCKRKKIIFLSSPFDLESIDLLNELGQEIFKIPSGEVTNLPYLRKIGSFEKKIIMSTGMSYLKEIKEAIKVLVCSGTKKQDITVLHCNVEYPADYRDANLNAILTMKDELGVSVGFSDHSLGIELSLAAVALGAFVIEKHFTLDKNMDGPDHKASIEPPEFSMMVAAIRHIESALGDGVKKPRGKELRNIDIVRKSIVASRGIKKGETFSAANITVKRPGTGINPMKWDKIVGRRAKKDFQEEELIRT